MLRTLSYLLLHPVSDSAVRYANHRRNSSLCHFRVPLVFLSGCNLVATAPIHALDLIIQRFSTVICEQRIQIQTQREIER